MPHQPGGRPISTQTNDLEQWSRFWEQGFITTFGSSKPENYDGVVLEFWTEKFVGLPDKTRILDIAAGNGAIATIAAELSEDLGKNFFVAATDLAQIHADIIGEDKTSAARRLIQFHSGVTCEQQPFEDDSFDMVTSQFGFEYSNIDKTIHEIRRVLVPGGRFVAISHHADSVLIESAKTELEIYALALDELDLVGTTRAYFEALGELPDDRQALTEAQQRARPKSAELNTRMNEFRSRYPDHDCAKFIVGVVTSVARSAQQTTLDQKQQVLLQADHDLRLARARLDDMVEAALTRDETQSLAVTARDAGFDSAHCLRLYTEDDGLAGWQIHLR